MRPPKSIDYAVMERTELAAVVPADLGWSDVGSWSSVWDLLEHDAAGNATEGPVVVLESRKVHSEESVLTTVVGLEESDRGVDRGRRAGRRAHEGGAGQGAGR